MNDPKPADAIAAAVDASAALLGLSIDPAHRPGVLQFYALAATMAEVVLAVPLAREDEPGSVWQAVDTGHLG